MSPVDRVPQILVAVSARPSPRPSDEVAVAVRVGPSARPPADRTSAGQGGSARRDARAFEDRTPSRSRSLPPLVSHGPEDVDWEGAEVVEAPFSEGAQWVDIASSGYRDAEAGGQATPVATPAYVTAGADVPSMRRLLAQQRGHSAYSLAPGARTMPAAAHGRSEPKQAAGAAPAPRLHIVA